MATKKAVSKKSAGKKAASKKGAKVKEPEVVVETTIESSEERGAVDVASEELATSDVDERIDLGNEVLAAVNASLGKMSKRGVPAEKVESAFYLAFQFAFCDFLRVTGFGFDQAIGDLREMYNREVVQQSEEG